MISNTVLSIIKGDLSSKEEEMSTYVTTSITSFAFNNNVNDTQIHTEGIEGAWAHAKAHAKVPGGTRDHMLQERLDEFIFHRTYLRDQPLNVFVMLRLIAKYGQKAMKFVMVDEKNLTSEKDKIYYRCEDIQQEEDAEEQKDDIKDNDDDEDQSGFHIDDDGNLIEYNEYGDIVQIRYMDPEQQEQAEAERQALADQSEDEPMRMETDAENADFDVELEDPLLYEQLTQYLARN